MPDTGRVTSTVVFLHGLGTTSRMWHEHARLLPDFQCLCPDLPGHGSARDRPWLSLERTAAEIASLIEAGPERRAHVVGLSLGGAVAFELMNTRPELLDRVLVDGASAISSRFTPLLAGGATAISPFIHSRPFLRAVAQLLSIKADRRPEFYREFRLVDNRSFRRSVGHALAVRLKNLSYGGPVLLLAGGRDVGSTRVSNATLARLLPDASAWYAPGAWHAWAGTNPDLHRAVVAAFLRGRPLPDGLAREDSPPRAALLTGGDRVRR
jgi:pimeloyl-ACP methyl ester carboxylesterase